MRVRLSKWLRSVRGKSEVAKLSPEGGARGLEEGALGVHEGAGKGNESQSHSDRLDFHNGVTREPNQLAVGPSEVSHGGGEDPQQLSKLSPADVLETQLSQQVPIVQHAPSHATGPRHLPPHPSPMSVPKASPACQQPLVPVESSACVCPSIPTDPAPFEGGASTLSPHHQALAGSAESIASVSVSSLHPSSALAACEEQQFERMKCHVIDQNLAEVQCLLKTPPTVSPMSGRLGTSRRQTQGLVRPDYDVSVLGKTAENANELAAWLAVEMNLRALSEAWVRGLRARDESSV